MRDAVEDSWEAHSRLQFQGWGMCTDIQGLQQFYGRPSTAGAKTIRFRHSGKCIDVPRSSRANGAGLIQYTCNHTTNQQVTLR